MVFRCGKALQDPECRGSVNRVRRKYHEVSRRDCRAIITIKICEFPILPNFDKNVFWRNCLLVAGISRELARMARIDPDIAFVCGMLHRIGDLLIRMAEPELSADIDGYEEIGVDRAGARQKVPGLDYSRAGSELANRRDFPEVIQNAIRYQLGLRNFVEGDNYAAVPGMAAHLVKVTEAGMDEDEDEFFPATTAKLLGTGEDRVLDRLEIILEKGEDLASRLS